MAFPRVIGHRGAAGLAPENTLAGFRAAKAAGAECVEFDVRLTRDGRAILLHDDTLARTTDGKGHAAELTFAEIRALDAGAWFAPEFRGERVPSLEEALEALGELGLGAVVELKPARGVEAETGRRVAAILERHWPTHLPEPLVSSFRPAALAAAAGVRRALLVGAVPRDWRRRIAALGAVALHADHRRLDRGKAAAIVAEDIPLFAYTVNSPARARLLFAWGVAAVFTDRPGLVN